ncbi:hypothetical protein [Vibrio sp. WXL210]|uniref:hypothetical protein n=1 Tax=Vibrio sp. WXL210 TaxID=3450709 RepID=UPI003EC8A6E2
MKKQILAAALIAASFGANAVGITPSVIGGKDQPLESIAMNGTKIARIGVKNTDQDRPTKYEIYVDGEFYGYTPAIDYGMISYMNVPVKVREMYKREEHKVCALAAIEKLENNGGARFAVCTKVRIIGVRPNED